jgi:hypothetical protein
VAEKIKRPAFQFYPADWRRDTAVQVCSLEARGLWHEMLCIMHDGTPYGHLSIEGQPVSVEQLARLVGENQNRVRRLLDELEAHHVFSRDANNPGLIYSRRMVRDEHKRDVAASNGSKGGNPALRDKRRSRDPVIQPVESLDKQTANQKPTPSVAVAVSSSVSSTLTTPPPPPRDAGYLAVADRIPAEYRVDFDALIDRVPSPVAWLAEIGASLDGMGGHKPVTGEQAGRAARDFNANGKEANLRLFRRFLEGAAFESSASPQRRSSTASRFAPPSDTTKAIIADMVAGKA